MEEIYWLVRYVYVRSYLYIDFFSPTKTVIQMAFFWKPVFWLMPCNVTCWGRFKWPGIFIWASSWCCFLQCVDAVFQVSWWVVLPNLWEPSGSLGEPVPCDESRLCSESHRWEIHPGTFTFYSSYALWCLGINFFPSAHTLLIVLL